MKKGRDWIYPDFRHADRTKRQEEFAFLKAADSIALQQSLRDLDRSFVNFFQNVLPIQPSRANITGSSHTERQSKR